MTAYGIEDHRADERGEKPPCLGQWCCGCSEHPIGKPWGWNYVAWDAHRRDHHPEVTVTPQSRPRCA